MPDPEIDRRCAACGASVRARAAYCPQCGQPITGHSDPHDGRAIPDLSETQPLRSVPDVGETLPLRSIPDFPETQPLSAFSPPVVSPVPPETNFKPARPTVHRAPEPEAKGPISKFRKASSVVFDQAAYDPSLRFLLVAAVLFLLFVILLILSKVMG